MVVSASANLSTDSMSRPMVAGDLDEDHDCNEDDEGDDYDADKDDDPLEIMYFMMNIAPK